MGPGNESLLNFVTSRSSNQDDLCPNILQNLPNSCPETKGQ